MFGRSLSLPGRAKLPPSGRLGAGLLGIGRVAGPLGIGRVAGPLGIGRVAGLLVAGRLMPAGRVIAPGAANNGPATSAVPASSASIRQRMG